MQNSWSLADFKRDAKPVVTNIAASLWDVGDGVACFEFNSKDNAIDYHTFKLLYDAANVVPKHFNCMIIGSDSVNFSSGINQNSLRYNFKIKEEIEYGQSILQMLKFSNFPIVAAVSGFTLDAGCEIALYCDSIQAYMKTYARLAKNALSGLGGYTEMILRSLERSDNAKKLIISENVTESAKQMYSLHILRSNDQVTTNRKTLLADAKKKALKLLHNYHPPQKKQVQLSELKLYFQNINNKSFTERLEATFGNQNFVSEKDILGFEKDVALEFLKNTSSVLPN